MYVADLGGLSAARIDAMHGFLSMISKQWIEPSQGGIDPPAIEITGLSEFPPWPPACAT